MNNETKVLNMVVLLNDEIGWITALSNKYHTVVIIVDISNISI